MGDGPVAYLITGISASGKSTVGQLLAERLGGVHVRGDVFRRMIVPERRESGRRPVRVRADMTPDAGAEAVRQLELRYRITAMVVDAYVEAGLDVIAQDVILGTHLETYAAAIRSRPLHVVALMPRPDVVVRRESERDKSAYSDLPGRWSVEELDDVLRNRTPRIGLWVDNSEQTAEETVEEILRRTEEARI